MRDSGHIVPLIVIEFDLPKNNENSNLTQSLETINNLTKIFIFC